MGSSEGLAVADAAPPSAIPLRRWQLMALLGALSMFAPLSTDMYLPALPSLAHSLHASASAVQLTLTASLIGLAVGQLVIGPLSDAFGRRRPVLLGLIAYTASSLGCALCGDVWSLCAMRLVQGAAGAAGIVVARAIVRDLFDGIEAARFYSRLVIVFGLAPILAPLIGAQLLHVTDWRGIFVALGAIGAVLAAVSWRALAETLAPAARHRGGLTATLRVLTVLVRNGPFAGLLAVYGLSFGAIFAYIAGSPFVLENVFGLSPQLFAVIFAVNAVALVGASQYGGRVVARVGARRLSGVGLYIGTLCSLALLAGVLAHAGLGLVLPCFFALMASYGILSPNLTTLAMTPFPRVAGSASALLGLTQFSVGAAVAPLVGVAGTHSAVPTAVVIATTLTVALGIWRSGVMRAAPRGEEALDGGG